MGIYKAQILQVNQWFSWKPTSSRSKLAVLKPQERSRGQTPLGVEVFAQKSQAKCLLDNDSRGFFSLLCR